MIRNHQLKNKKTNYHSECLLLRSNLLSSIEKRLQRKALQISFKAKFIKTYTVPLNILGIYLDFDVSSLPPYPLTLFILKLLPIYQSKASTFQLEIPGRNVLFLYIRTRVIQGDYPKITLNFNDMVYNTVTFPQVQYSFYPKRN